MFLCTNVNFNLLKGTVNNSIFVYNYKLNDYFANYKC